MATTRKGTYNISFTALFDTPGAAMLDAVAARLRRPKAHIIRDGVTAAYNMACAQRPTCADGTACRCPQMHQQLPPVTPPTNPDPQPSEADGYGSPPPHF